MLCKTGWMLVVLILDVILDVSDFCCSTFCFIEDWDIEPPTRKVENLLHWLRPHRPPSIPIHLTQQPTTALVSVTNSRFDHHHENAPSTRPTKLHRSSKSPKPKLQKMSNKSNTNLWNNKRKCPLEFQGLSLATANGETSSAPTVITERPATSQPASWTITDLVAASIRDWRSSSNLKPSAGDFWSIFDAITTTTSIHGTVADCVERVKHAVVVVEALRSTIG